jgi:hypothetical protein
MNTTDYGLLLNTSYRGWKAFHAAYLELATQVASGIEVPRSDVDAAREDARRALSDFMSIDEQTPGQTREADAQAVAQRPA